MLAYQEQYISNMREIAQLADFFCDAGNGFEEWFQKRKEAGIKSERLKAENISLLNDHLFPTLDHLHEASAEEIQDLVAFADALMDWKENLDCGVYIVIHDALLSVCRTRKDRNGMIRELYKLGMGHYYRNRMIQGIDETKTNSFIFENEMLFTEAGTYLKYFEEIEDEETKGYIIRALANISICTRDRRKRVAVSARILQIVQDPYYRNLAPSIPWDIFLRKTHQQMSANRSVLSSGGMSTDELAAVLESCQYVFEPEKNTGNPEIRWLWPYYEMEYSCGFADLSTTLGRMERLIMHMPYDRYDESGLYANVQLPVYYGRLLRDNPSRQKKNTGFLQYAYEKMMNTLMTYPVAEVSDYLIYMITLVLTDYLEIEGVETYQSMTMKIMQRYAGNLYIDSCVVADIMQVICKYIYQEDPHFFDDIPHLKNPETELMEYAKFCGMYHDFGLLKMQISRLMQSRNLFDHESGIFQLHAISGYDDLKARPSTSPYADIALGHHRYYNGNDGYPEEYIRNHSPYRQMVDIAAIAVAIKDEFSSGKEDLFADIISREHKQFSPVITSYLHNASLLEEIENILTSKTKYYQDMYRQMKGL
ncbi:MAG: hypothetical protein IKR11_09685 [Solobacterium sp.]|nr:hypothetical protein [Solobacterium sp.]